MSGWRCFLALIWTSGNEDRSVLVLGPPRQATGPTRQATGPPRSGAGVGVGMLRGAGDPLRIFLDLEIYQDSTIVKIFVTYYQISISCFLIDIGLI